MTSVREATRSDAAEMARIQTESLRQRARDHYTDEQLAHLAPPDPDADAIPDSEFDDSSRRPVVAERDGTIVGWGSVHVDEGVLAATFVDPDHFGEGIGRAIVERLEATARKEGLDQLTVFASLNAVGFYDALGYERRREVDAGGPESPEIPSVELAKDRI
jgi:GNAT superfamily N-acetyltransferase